MMQKIKFYPKLHIAALANSEDNDDLKVLNLIQDIRQKQPSINAFLGARYSRSADSVVEIASEVMSVNQDTSKKLETIFYGYGHKSVGDMADIFLCLENIPILVAQRIFYSIPVHSGQERSTRYQDFSKPRFFKLPTKYQKTKSAKEYEEIIKKQLADYNELLSISEKALIKHFKIDLNNPSERGALKARAFDTARYFIPCGVKTSMAILTSARHWGEKISYLRSSTLSVERQLGELIFKLLTADKSTNDTPYIPEADSLIKHADANMRRFETTNKIIKILKKSNKKERVNYQKYFKVSQNLDYYYELLANTIIQELPLNTKYKISKKDILKAARIIFNNHNHHNQIGTVGQSGSVLLHGFADYGSLKDLNRHRSLERIIPLYEDNLNIINELDRKPEDCFTLCSYLNIPQLKELKVEYHKRFVENYSRIQKWVTRAKREIGMELTNEFGKYLLPHGHLTQYKIYGSIDDLQYVIALRTRNGGHISYRELTYKWLTELTKSNPFWGVLLNKIPKVDFTSRKQFVDRS